MDSKYLFGANAAAAIRSQAQKTIKVPSKKTTTAEEKKLKQDIDRVKKKANAEAKPNTVNHIGLDLLRHPEKAFKTELMPAEYIIKDQAGAENTLKKIGDIEKENKNLEEYLKFYKTLGLDQNIKTTSERIKSNEKKLRWFEQAYADWDASVTLQAKKQERARYRKNRRSQEEINRDLENLRKDAYKKGALTSDEVRDLRIAEQGLRKELEWAKAFDYEDLSKRPDFAQKSKFKSTKHGELEYYDWGNVVADTGYDDALYDMINGDESAKQAYMQQTEQAKLSLLGFGNGYLENLSSDELSTYNYLHTLDDEAHKNGISQNKADEYLKFLADNDVLLEGDLKRRERVQLEKDMKSYAIKHPIMATAESIAVSPFKGLGYVGQAVDYLTTGKVDEDAGYNQHSHTQKAIRQTVSSNFGKVGSFLYQTGMSMADFILGTAISGGNSAVALTIMGTGAAADATIAAKEKGLSDDKAFAIGTIAGAAEILTEKISIDALLDKTTLNKSLFGYWLKNTVAEGSEEVASDFINLFSDVILSKEKSDWNQSIEKYKEKGMSKKDAFWTAFGDQMSEMGLDFMGGAISGGAFAAASIGINTLGNLNTRRKISDTFGENGRETFISIMPENIDYKTARAAIDFYNLGLKGGNINDIGTESFNALPEEVGNAMIKAGMKDRSIAKSGNAVYNDINAGNAVTDDVASGELDSEGAPIYARTRKEANIEGTDFSKLNKTRKQADIDFGLERQESVALTGYINTTFARLNKALNAGIATEADLKKADSISSALKKFPTYDGRTYRNLRFESDSTYNDFLAKYAKGKKVALEAFTSTSKRPNGYPIFEGRVVHMVIDGQTGADIADTYGLPRQQEVIYLPGTEIEITNISTANDGNPIIYVQEAISNGVERNNENSRPAQSVDTNRQKDRGGKTLDSGYGGSNREIHADSWDNTGGNGVLSERRPSDIGGRSLQRGRADRITANDTVQAGEAVRSKMFGQRGTEVFDGFTSEQRSNPEFVNAMALFYNAGNKGTSVNDISEQYRFVGTQEQREAMYKAGIADAARSVAQNGDVSYSEITEKGGNVNEEKTARYGRGQERTPGVASGGQGRSLEAGTGSFETGRPGGDQAQRAVSIRNRADAAGIVSQSTQAQGISIGTDNKTLKVLPSNLWDDEIRTVVREKAQSGIQVVPFVGQLECKDENGTFTANGWMSPDGKRMYVRADHDTLTMKQLSDHEEYHDKARKDKKLDAKLKKQLARKYGKGWEKFLSRAYAEIYFSGQDMDKSLSDYILQEILADAYAGIDVLRNVENVPMRATNITAQVRETADRVKSRGPPIQTDGGVGRFSYAGRNAKTANVDTLESAQKMKSDGVDAETIFRQTGWYTGADGKWRFEIDDSGMEITKEYLLLTEGEYLLRDIVSHNELFKAYPQIGDTKVKVARLNMAKNGVAGFYDEKSDTITLNSAIYLTDDMLLDLLVHEIQHKIQRIEGLSRGSSPGYWKERGIGEDEYNRFKEGTQLKLERELRRLNESDRADMRRYFELDRQTSDAISNVEALYERNDFAGTSSILDRIDAIEHEHDALYKKLYSNEWFGRIVDLQNQMDVSEDLYTVFYKNTAGEIEARDVTSRRTMTEEERRATMPNIGDETTVFAEEAADGRQYSISKTLGEDLQKVLDGTFRTRGNEVYIGETSNFLTDVIGADSLRVTMPSSKAYSAMATEEQARADGRYDEDVHYHGLGIDGLMKALEASENPVAAFADTGNENGKRIGNIVLATDEVGEDGNIVVVEALNAKGYLQGKRIEANKVVSSYDRRALANDIIQAAADGRLLHLDKKRSQTILAGVSAVNPQRAIQEVDFENNIQDFWANVKWAQSGNTEYSSKGSGEEKTAFARAYEEAQKKRSAKGIVDQFVSEYKQEHPNGSFSREADLSDPELQKRLTALLEEYGAIKPGENPFRNIEIPQRTEKDNKVSQTVRTILEAKATPDEVLPTIESLVAEGAFSNEVYTDKKAMRDAEEEITEKGYTRAFADWSNKSSGISKRNTAIGFALYNAAVNSGDVKTAIDVLDTMVRRQHDAAQAVQATRILKKLTPEGQLYSAVRSVQNIESELRKKYGAKAEEIKVNSELAEKFLNAKDEDARNEAMTEIWRDVGRQLPSTFRDKWNAWRYLAMLGNPRTHVRNIAGNAFFAPLVAAKDMIATGIESAVDALSKNGIDRQKAFVGFGTGDRALFSAAFADFKNVESIALGEGKYSEGLSSNKAIEEGRKIFKFKPLEAARKGNSKLLDVEDKLFSRPHYAYAMSQYCKANGISAEQIRSGKGLENARAYAIKEAQKATYRDTNAFSEFISGIGRFSEYDSEGNAKTAGKLGNLAVEGVLPFRKTPANILVRAAEYSPAQLIRVLASDISKVRQGKMGAAEMIDHISSGLVGTGILALGAFLASLGLVVGHGGGDDEERENAKRVGKQNYALLLPDGTSYTLDWLAPESIPFFIGVNIVEEIRTNNGDADMSSILSAISNATEPMIDMSCLQGLNDLLDNIGYAKSNGQSALTKILAATATSYFGQVVPTLLGQINRTMQDKRYTTFSDKNNKYMTSDMQYTLGKYASKIPGLGFNQVPYIDAWGNEQKTGNVAQRAFNNLINPGYVSESKETKVDKELLRLYRKTGETPFPSRAKSSLLINDAQVNLTAPEYIKYAKEKGQTSYRILDKMIKSDIYKESEDIDKVKLIEAVYDYANQEAKSNVSDFTPSKWVKKVMTTTAEYNIPEETYIMLYKKQSEIEGIKDKNGETIENSRGLLVMQLVYSVSELTDRQRKALFEDFGVGKKIRHYNKALVNQKLKRYSKAA